MSGDSGQTAKPPDMTWANTQWGTQLNTANENMRTALKWAQDHGTTLDEALKQIQPQMLAAGAGQLGIGQQLFQKYQDMYGPLQEAQAKYAMNYASPERIKQAQAEAGAGVSNAFKAAGDAANRDLERYGVDPSVGRGGALDLGIKLKEATAKAGAMDNARRATETTGQGLINQAIGTGQQVAGTAQQAYAGGVGADTSALGAGINTMTAQSPMLGNSLGWFGGGNQALGGFVNTTQAAFQDASHNADVRNQATAAENAGWGKLAGSVIGAAGSMMMAADGGMIPSFSDGGDTAGGAGGAPSPGSAVPLSASPSRGAVEDDVPARVQPGEFIFPKDVMAWKGEEWAQKEIMKARAAQHNPDGKPAKPEAKPALDLPPTYRSPGSLHGQAVPLGNHAHAGA